MSFAELALNDKESGQYQICQRCADHTYQAATSSQHLN
jgi:hypothetical protein